MRVKVEEANKLDKYLENREKSSEIRALVLKMIEKKNNIEEISKLTEISESTIYRWLEEWNKKKK
jgi:transposase